MAGKDAPGKEARFDEITRAAALALGVETAAIIAANAADPRVLSCYGRAIPQLPREVLFGKRGGATARLTVVEDTRRDARFTAPHVGFYAGYTLVGADEQVLGTLCLTDERARRLDGRGTELLQALARWAQDAIETDARESGRLEAANSRLVSPAIHQIRGALTSIHGFSDFLLNQESADGPRREALSVIHDKANELARVLTELVELMQLEIAGCALRRSAQPLEPLLRDIVADFRGDRAVTLRADEHLPPANVDPERIRQALLNLLQYVNSNGSATGDAIDLSLGRATEPGFLALSVGPLFLPLEARDLNRVFEPFFRADNGELQRAETAALALTRAIAESHGGRTFIERDQRDRGARITVLLPV